MVSKHNQSQFSVDRMDREDFTSDSDEDEILLGEGGKIEELVLEIRCEGLSKQNEDFFGILPTERNGFAVGSRINPGTHPGTAQQKSSTLSQTKMS